jgi:OmpA family protein
MPSILKPLGAALLASCLHGTAGAQAIDPENNRLPRFYADVCGTGGEGRGSAAFSAPGSSEPGAGSSERHLRYVLDGAQRDGGWVLLTGHVDGAEAGEAGRLDLRRAEAVRDWLVARGLHPERVWSRGRGADDPHVATDGAEPQNRRVDFLLTNQGNACRRDLRSGIQAWFRQNCFPTLRAAEAADCDEALRSLR